MRATKPTADQIEAAASALRAVLIRLGLSNHPPERVRLLLCGWLLLQESLKTL